MIHATPEEAKAIAEASRFAGLKDKHHYQVRQYLYQDPEGWFFCCASACDPCVLTLRIAVDKARELLGAEGYE